MVRAATALVFAILPATGAAESLFVLRYDDVAPMTGDEEVDASNYRADEGIIEAFRQEDVPVTLAVIPFAGDMSVLDDDRLIRTLRRGVRDGTAEVALHGYRHTDWHLHGVPSEWAGVPREEQVTRLRAGKTALERAIGAPVETFVPPFNTYDSNTLRALSVTGFTCVSARLGEPSIDGPIHYVPWIAYEFGPSGERDPYATARAALDDGGPTITVFMLHRADFNGARACPYGFDSLADLSEFLRWLKTAGGTVVTASGAAEMLPAETSGSKYAAAVSGYRGMRLWHKVTSGSSNPLTGPGVEAWPVYWSAEVYDAWRMVYVGMIACVCMTGLALGALAGRAGAGRRLAYGLFVVSAAVASALAWPPISARLHHKDHEDLHVLAVGIAVFLLALASGALLTAWRRKVRLSDAVVGPGGSPTAVVRLPRARES